MKTKEQYESELKRLLAEQNAAKLEASLIDSIEFRDKWTVAFKKYKKAEKEYTKLLDEYVTQYSKSKY